MKTHLPRKPLLITAALTAIILAACSPHPHVYAGIEDSRYVGDARMSYTYRVDNGLGGHRLPPPPKHHKESKQDKKIRKAHEKEMKKIRKAHEKQMKKAKKQGKKHRH